MSGGTEWLVDAFGCDPARLASPSALLALSDEVVARLGLHVLGTPAIHHFPAPGGVTGLYLLSESHWAWHTYPESELATFNLYCCRALPSLDWSGVLGAALAAQRVEVTRVQRGLGAVFAGRQPRPAVGTACTAASPLAAPLPGTGK